MTNFVFQQHSAPAHGARNTVQLLEQKTLSFITHEHSCSVRIKRITRFGKNARILTYFIIRTKFTFFNRNFLCVHTSPYVDVIKLN